MKIHKNAMEIPTTLEEKKKLLEWLEEHPLWTHPITFKYYKNDGGDNHFLEMFGKDVVLENAIDCGDYWEVPSTNGELYACIEVTHVYVNPETNRIDDDDLKNTEFQVWIEGGGWDDSSLDENIPVPDEGWNQYNKWMRCHDVELDCGAVDMETALLELAVRVKFFYEDKKDHRDDIPKQCKWIKNDKTCKADGGGYCKQCGYRMDFWTLNYEEKQ